MNKSLPVRKLPTRFTTVSQEAWPRIYIYCAVFLLAFIGNILVLNSACRRRQLRFSSVNKLLLNLGVADLTVSVMYAAVEVVWRVTIGWYAGDFLCKLIQFVRAFSLYLSSFILICITLDRYYAVVHPLTVMDGSKRVKIMIISSWILSVICALPQCLLFRVESHPKFPEFHQCATMWLGERAERCNTFFSVVVMYFIPLGVILFSYFNILHVLYKGSSIAQVPESVRDEAVLRRSGISLLKQAKHRTLKLALVIVLAFLICWTPYIIITVWHMIDRDSAEKIYVRTQDALFIMLCANSCVNPFIYGYFQIHRRVRHPNHQHSFSTMHENFSWRRVSNRRGHEETRV